MTPTELLDTARTERAAGHKYIHVVIRRARKAPGSRAFVMAGLYGHLVGELQRADDGARLFLVDVSIVAIERRLAGFTGSGFDLASVTFY